MSLAASPGSVLWPRLRRGGFTRLSTRTLCAREGRVPVDVARAFLSAGARLIQLRCKSWGSAAFLDLANAVVEDANRAGAAVIVNDRADVAALSRAHGLHVGQDDLAPADARSVIGDEPLLGLSTHTREQWEAALTQPVCYIAIGPVFGTGTKDTGYKAVGLDDRAACGGGRGTRGPADGGDRRHHARQRGVGDRGRRRLGGDHQRSCCAAIRKRAAALCCESSNKTHL